MPQRLWDLLDTWLFGAPSLGEGPTARLLRVLRYPFAVLRDLAGGELNMRAMGLVYATLLAIVPALALSFAVLTAFEIHRDLEPLIFEFFRPLGDAAPEITQRILGFADTVRSGLVGTLGFALLLWTLIGAVKKVEDSFNFVWRVKLSRSLGRRIAEYALLLVAAPLLLAVVVGFSKLALDRVTLYAPTNVPLLARLVDTGVSLAPYVIVTGMFVFLYRVIPNTRVQLVPALVGALAAGVLWAATGKLFATMVVYTTRLTIVYAGFAIVVALLLWTWLGWLILLAGAQLSFYLQNPSYLRIGGRPLKLSNHERERLGLNILLLVARGHHEGRPPWTLSGLCDELGVPGTAVADLVETLEQARLLAVTDRDEIYPGRDIGSIRLAEALDVLRRQRIGHGQLRIGSLPAVAALQEEIDVRISDVAGDRTLRDLVG
jgi:membrane protein